MTQGQFESVKLGKLAEIIAAQVRDDIRTGTILIGSKLPPEKDLIEQFGVSRSIVREALRLLESDGFVVIRSGRNGGAVLTMPRIERLATILDVMLAVEKTELAQLIEARAFIEPIAARLAAERATEEEMSRIEESMALIRNSPEDDALFAEQTVRFHVLVAAATHNSVIHALTAITQQLIFSRAQEQIGSEPEGTLRAHLRIFEAIQARDSELAARRMARHVEAFEGHLLTTPS
jgi:DNA-binding FadR family transcriptional regulator